MNKIYTENDIVRSKNILSCNVDLSRTSFSKNLRDSCKCAFEFAKSLVTNTLPNKIRYIVSLGASYDKYDLEEGEEIFPSEHEAKKRIFCKIEEVLDLLWREGKVPEWINVYVDSEDGEFTYLKLVCCGRYSSNPDHIYHAHEGRAPFHVLGPQIPSGNDGATLNRTHN